MRKPLANRGLHICPKCWYDKRVNAPIAQWIERCPPEAEAQVRVLVGAKKIKAPLCAFFDFIGGLDSSYISD